MVLFFKKDGAKVKKKFCPLFCEQALLGFSCSFAEEWHDCHFTNTEHTFGA
jgi:hypothetical protein